VHPASRRWLEHLAASSAGGERLSVRITSQVVGGVRPGFPLNVVDSRQVPVEGVVLDPSYGASESSWRGGYPLPAGAKVEGYPGVAWDQHVVVVDTAECSVYELFMYPPLYKAVLGAHFALGGARWELRDGRTPGAGGTVASQVPLLAGVARVDEVRSGRVDHLLRGCSAGLSGAHTWPARRSDGDDDPSVAPPMGTRLRLRAEVPLDRFSGQGRVLARAMAEHGVLLDDTCDAGVAVTAENGEGWVDAELAPLGSLTLDDFEVVDQTPMVVSPESWQVR
jgi:hypothetical protein